jgi:fructosamine-3-kinase
VRGVTPVGGGSVGAAARVDTSSGALFVKWADGEARASFGSEAEGLARLAAVAPPDLVVPGALDAGDDGATGWIVLPWLDAGRPDADAWRRFGRALAALHAAPPDVDDPARPYGQPRDGWIGRKPQATGLDADWARFFGERRLLAQAAVVRARGAWEARWDVPLERLVGRLADVIPSRPPPATLHGDLWAGNALALASR